MTVERWLSLNSIRSRSDRCGVAGAQAGKEIGDARLELVMEHEVLSFVDFAPMRDFEGIHQHGALATKDLQRVPHHLVPVESPGIVHYAESGAAQARGIQTGRVVWSGAVQAGDGIGSSGSGPARAFRRSAASRTVRAMGAGGVLGSGNRDDAAPADQADGGLTPTMPLTEDGLTMEPSVSVPTAAAARLEATATATVNSIRMRCGQGHRDFGSDPRANSSHWWTGWIENSPTR